MRTPSTRNPFAATVVSSRGMEPGLTPPHDINSILFSVLFIGMGIAVCCIIFALLSGCGTTAAQLDRYQATYAAATNALAQVHGAVIPFIPPPFNGVAEGITAIVGGSLAAWNGWQHRQLNQQASAIKVLENGHNLPPVSATVRLAKQPVHTSPA